MSWKYGSFLFSNSSLCSLLHKFYFNVGFKTALAVVTFALTIITPTLAIVHT